MKDIPAIAAAVLSVLLVYTLATEDKRFEKRLIGATAECKSGHYTTAKRGQGVCSGHGGVKYWIEQGPRE